MIGLDGDLGNPKNKVIMMVMVKFDPPKVTMVILKYLKVLKRMVLLMVLPSVAVVQMVALCPLAVVHLGPVSRSLGPMDTFMLDVLRGWRLLVAASLSADEWRDILASTGNKLDYHAIAEALQTLWDEQVGGSQMRMSNPHFSQHWTELDYWYDGMAA